MAKLEKVKNISMVESVTNQIENAIFTGEYQPGDKLPSIRALQEILGASLGTVRESLAILEQKGILEVRKGAKGGFFIRRVSPQHMINSIEFLMRYMTISHKELYEFRANVETGLFRLVTRRATKADMESFRDYLDKLRDCINKGQKGWFRLIKIENDLRLRCLKIINNRAYQIVLTPIISNLQDYARYHRFGGDGETREAVAYWEKIIPAIEARDEKKVGRLVEQLLYRFMELLEENA
ncbi:MAG: GntR family transcriptional regulator [Desulfobacterales bacterium]|nr:GntR family transcriptional regulator [Desulfobacterales bacterium]